MSVIRPETDSSWTHSTFIQTISPVLETQIRGHASCRMTSGLHLGADPEGPETT